MKIQKVTDGVFRVQGVDGRVPGDETNFKEQGIPDGYISFQDAEFAGISTQEWTEFVENFDELQPEQQYQAYLRLFARNSTDEKVSLRAKGIKLHVSPERARVLREMLSKARQLNEGTNDEPNLFPHSEMLPNAMMGSVEGIAGDSGTTKLFSRFSGMMNPEELKWFSSQLHDYTEKVTLSDGRVHFMRPDVKKVMDDKLAALKSEIMEARRAGKLVVYMSHPIGGGNIEINKAVAKFIHERLNDDDNLWLNSYSLNPAAIQIDIDATGDDWMYLWSQLLDFNLFDVVRFTSDEDYRQFYNEVGPQVLEELGHPMSKEEWMSYTHKNGSYLRSTGCRYEYNIIVRINQHCAAEGAAHHMVLIYVGDKAVSGKDLTTEVDTVSYKSRGE